MEVFSTQIFRTDWIEYKGEKLKRQEVIRDGKTIRLNWVFFDTLYSFDGVSRRKWEFCENEQELEMIWQQIQTTTKEN